MPQSTKTPGDRRYSDESLDPSQAAYDDEFNKIVGNMSDVEDQADAYARDHEGNNDSNSGDDGYFDRLANRRGDKLDARSNAAADRRAAEKKEWDEAANLMNYKKKGEDNTPQKTTGGGYFNKKNAIRGGIAGGIIGIALVIFGFLSPFKLPALMQVVTDVTGQRVEQITTHRAKVILARAILSKFGSGGGVVITGKGPVSTLIATMRTNKFEEKLKAKGLEIVDANKDGVRIKVNGNFIANGGRLTSDRLVMNALEENHLTNQIINDMVKEEIPTWRWLKRAKFAAWLRIKYAIHRFGTKKTAETDKEAKIADIQEDRLNTRYGQYAENLSGAIGCIMGEPGCPVDDPSKNSMIENLRAKAGQKAAAVKEALKTAVQDQTKIIINDATKSIVAKINAQLEKILIKQFAAKAIPIIGWIDLAATLDHIAYEFAENDYLAKVPSYYRAMSFAQMYGEWVGYGDQAKAGEMDNDVMALLTGQLDGAETSQAFNYIMGNAARGVPVKVRVDENNPSLIKKGWEQIKANPASAYYRYVSHPVMDAYYNTIGGGGLLGAASDFLGSLISRGIGWVAGILPQEWTDAISAYMSDMIGKLFVLIGMSADPLDQGADWFNDVYAGGDVSFNTYCKELGCRRLTDAQVATQNASIAIERAQDIKSKGVMYALFSPEATHSFTNQLAMSTPSTLTLSNLNLADGFGQLASIVTGTPSRLMSTKTNAAQGYVNLNGVINYGALNSDLEQAVAPEAISADECPDVAEGDYDNCAIDKTVAEAMECNFDTDNPKCNFTTSAASVGGVGVMSYNILGSTHNNDGGQSWQARLDAVIRTVQTEQPDIVGFQEVSGEDGQRTGLKEKLGTTYDVWPYIGDGQQDAVARPIYWNKTKYSLADKGVFEFPRYSNSNAKFPWIKLQHIASGTQFYVFNTHTAAGDKNSHEYFYGNMPPPQERKMETEKMLEAINTIVPAGVPTVLTGDYNSTCTASGHDSPMGQDEIPCTILEKAGFTDAGTAAFKAGRAENYEYNTSHGTAGSTRDKKAGGTGRHIDHIFFNNGVQVANWKNVITEDTKNASDHTPVIAGLSIPGIISDTGNDVGGGEVTASGFAWPLGQNNWEGHKSSFLASHYSSGGFLGDGKESVDISWSGIDGTQAYAMLGGTVTKQPIGRTGTQCHGNPDGNDNGGMIITSQVGGNTVQIAYAHGDDIKAGLNKTVKAGDPIMDVGNVGNSCGAHLHMNVTVNNKNICPQDLFLAMAKGGEINLTELAKKATPTCGGRG